MMQLSIWGLINDEFWRCKISCNSGICLGQFLELLLDEAVEGRFVLEGGVIWTKGRYAPRYRGFITVIV